MSDLLYFLKFERINTDLYINCFDENITNKVTSLSRTCNASGIK